MTISEAITRTDTIAPNNIQTAEKIYWLSTVEASIKREIIDPRAGTPGEEFVPYTEETPGDTELLAPPPYDELYLRYLEMQIHYCNRDEARHNNCMDLFDRVWTAFERWYRRTHPALLKNLKFF